jgi:hypothetical protein
MFKKLIAFAFGIGISLSASAGYIQYDLQDVRFNDGGTVTGSFVQDTDTRAIAYYSLQTGGANFGNQYFVSGSYANLVSAHTNFTTPGPTSFESYLNVDDRFRATLNLDFNWATQAEHYNVAGSENSPVFTSGWVFMSRTITGGTLVQGTIDPGLLAALESGQTEGIINLIPALPQAPAGVPEPGSLALLAIGAFGLIYCLMPRQPMSRRYCAPLKWILSTVS